MLDQTEYKGYTIEIHQDDDPMHPRHESDHFGKIVAWHQQYNLGDKGEPDYRSIHLSSGMLDYLCRQAVGDKFDTFIWKIDDDIDTTWNTYKYPKARNKKIAKLEQQLKEFKEKCLDDLVLLDVYIYDHSGITIKCTPFHDPWDSGQVGVIYATKESVIKEFGDFSQESKQKAIDLLKSEIKEYDAYLTGSVLGFIIKDPNGTEIDSCWGFYEETKDVIESAKEVVDYHIESSIGENI